MDTNTAEILRRVPVLLEIIRFGGCVNFRFVHRVVKFGGVYVKNSTPKCESVWLLLRYTTGLYRNTLVLYAHELVNKYLCIDSC